MTTNHDALRKAFNAFLLEQHERHKHQHNHFHVARNEWARRTQSTQYEALAASKHEPQAQAGELEALYEADMYGELQPLRSHSVSPGDKFITLQSHREAIAQHQAEMTRTQNALNWATSEAEKYLDQIEAYRAALEECVLPSSYRAGTLVSDPEGGAKVTLYFDDTKEAEHWFDAAITHANQVLEGGGK